MWRQRDRGPDSALNSAADQRVHGSPAVGQADVTRSEKQRNRRHPTDGHVSHVATLESGAVVPAVLP